MKPLILALFMAGAAIAQTNITTFSLTKDDCSPKSMLMLFRPPGFVCAVSTTVLITGDASAYEVEIEFKRASGIISTERTFLKANEYKEAKWVIYEDGVKVLRVSAIPHFPANPETRIF